MSGISQHALLTSREALRCLSKRTAIVRRFETAHTRIALREAPAEAHQSEGHNFKQTIFYLDAKDGSVVAINAKDRAKASRQRFGSMLATPTKQIARKAFRLT